jgi:RNA-directed DNA polymerase
MNAFDHWVKCDLGIKYYGRYVDDFVLVHNDKEHLKSLIATIRNYLDETLNLILHPDKIYLQHYSKGVQYLGAIIKPHRVYISNHTKGNFYETIENQNLIARAHKPTKEERGKFLSSINSYLGIIAYAGQIDQSAPV